MLSFFLSMEYLERAVRTLATGDDRRNDPLLSVDVDVQDVVLRSSHPSPTSRLRWICRVMTPPEARGGDSTTTMISNQLEDILSHVWEEIYPLLQELHASGVRPHRKWVDPSTEMSCALV